MHKELFDQLVQVVATLRGENGCPWDKAQTHETLKGDLIEETYEVIEAIDAKSTDKLQEELGDLLMNVMLHAQIAKDQGDFSINEVVRSITDKLIRRHPHVFGDVDATILRQCFRIGRQLSGARPAMRIGNPSSTGCQNPCRACCERRRFRTEPPASDSIGTASPMSFLN